MNQQGIQAADGTKPSTVREAIWTEFERSFGMSPELMIRASDAPDVNMVDIGDELSGAGWAHNPNFIITSAFIRLLGTLEQYEQNVLKCLLYYRPSGTPLGSDAEHMEISAETDVFLESPMDPDSEKPVYLKPPIWTWLRKHAENNIERRTIFNRVYGIDLIPMGGQSKESNKNRERWYKQRNAIAHGRRKVEMTLKEYVRVEVFVTKSMFSISKQCKDKLKLIV